MTNDASPENLRKFLESDDPAPSLAAAVAAVAVIALRRPRKP